MMSRSVEGGWRWGAPSSRPNPHVDYRQRRRLHHIVVAKAVTSRLSSGVVLDVGCGVGHTLAEIHVRQPELKLVAADTDPECLRITSDRIRIDDTVLMEGGNVPSLGPEFDAVVLSHVLEHVDHPSAFLRQALSLLAPGGFMVLAVPNPVRPEVFLYSLLRRHYVNPGHRYAWDRSHWMNFLEVHLGLRVEAYLHDEIRMPLIDRIPGAAAAGLLMGRVLPWLTFSNITVVRVQSGRTSNEVA